MIFITIPLMKRKGMAFFPFIFIKHKNLKLDEKLVNHEKIHIRQQLELLVLPFYLLYFINYLYNLIQYLDHESAYRHIVFEKEAYDHEADINYLKTRRHFAYIYYF